jgi:hypothetical protein
MVDFSFGNSEKGLKLGKKLKEKFPNISFGLDSEIIVCDLKEGQYEEALRLLVLSGLGHTIWNKDMAKLYKKKYEISRYDDYYSEEDYEQEKETGRCRYCGNYLLECNCDTDF